MDRLRILAIIGIFVLIFSILYVSRKQIEGLEPIPIQYKKNTTNVIDGYYQIDGQTMAAIPYGYIRDPTNHTKIIPNTEATISKNAPAEIKPPKKGEPLPEDYYLLDENNLAILPPTMKPKLANLEIHRNPPVLKYTYDTGYMGETRYYKLEFPVDNAKISALPKNVYYTTEKKNRISLLRPDEKADKKGWGKMLKGNAPNPETTRWSKVKDNYDVEFHESADVLMAREDAAGQCATVITPEGDRLCIPPIEARGKALFYNPGSYKYGGINYIPKYEDSVYLSRTTQQPAVTNYESTNTGHGFCFFSSMFPTVVEQECAKLDKHVCASTGCCVLVGGQKCVAGNSTGPTNPAHYKDPALSVTDHYFHSGKCYGNCFAVSPTYPNAYENTLFTSYGKPPDFSPLNIIGCILHLDATDASMIDFSGSSVFKWMDKSPNKNDMTTKTDIGATVTKINSRNILSFTNNAEMYNATIKLPTTYTIFSVGYTNYKSPVDGYARMISGNESIMFLGNNNGNYSTFVGNGVKWNDISANTPEINVSSLNIFEMTNDNTPTGLIPYVTGKAQSAKNGSTVESTGLYVGGGFQKQTWGGYIGEIIIYNSVLSKIDRETVETYLKNKWSIN